MKNQYFGDKLDYAKYGLLRCLGNGGETSIAVCWMLTPDEDDGREGNRLDHLRNRDRWRHYDPQVWDLLHESVCNRGIRHIRRIEESGLLGDAVFYPSPERNYAPVGRDERDAYFDGFFERAKGRGLAFFDPDNGLEVSRLTPNQVRSTKYLFFSDVERAYKVHQLSLLIFQIMGRKNRDDAEAERVCQLRKATRASLVYAFRAPFVTYFLVPQPRHEARFEAAAARFEESWRGFVEVRRHRG